MQSLGEQITKKRLLIDGDGNGDDRRINTLAKQFLQWTTHTLPQDAEDAELTKKLSAEDEKLHSTIMAQLLQCKWQHQKLKLVQTMTQEETTNYEGIYRRISDEYKKAELMIKETRVELAKAQKVRRNRLEYDAMAKVIKEYPDRNTMSKKLEEVDQEIDKLKKEEESLDEKLCLRKKQFHLLVHTIHELQDLLDTDGDDNGSASEVTSDEEDTQNMDIN